MYYGHLSVKIFECNVFPITLKYVYATHILFFPRPRPRPNAFNTEIIH